MEPQPPRSRRSKTNLAHLTLAPLSTRLPIDSDADDSPVETEHTVHVKSDSGNETLSSYHTFRSSTSRPHSPHYTSYITGKSAPTTPRILSRNASPSRQGARKAKDGKGPVRGKGSKSYSALQGLDSSIPSGRTSGVQTPHVPLTKISTEPAGTEPTVGVPLTKSRTAHPPRSKSSKHAKSKSLHADSAEWLFRAGTAISEGARESKGQTWLVSRESSTSLAAAQKAEAYPQHSSDDEETQQPNRSPYVSRPGSRAHSRTRRRSRGSHTASSSRGDIAALRRELVAGFTPVIQTPRYESGVPAPDLQPLTAAPEEDYFSHAPHSHSSSRRGRRRGSTPHAGEVPGPDFVDLNNEPPSPSSVSSASYSSQSADEAEVSRKEDAEIAALARERGLGFGLGWVDRLVAWTVFAPHDAEDQVRDTDIEGADEENAADSDSDPGTTGYSSGVVTPARGQGLTTRPLATDRVSASITSSADKGKGKARAPPPPAEEGEGGWKDAAWLLGVATKVIF